MAARVRAHETQKLRLWFQVAFLLLNLWLGTQFYFFVRGFETGAGPVVSRPPGVEGFLPIAGMMNTKYWALTGRVPDVHPAAMALLLAFVTMSLLMRKSFCSWLCPVGTISEYLWKTGRKTFRRNFAAPRRLDIGLRGLKYLLLAFFVWAVGGMSVGAIEQFILSPYGLVADVKMLNFFRHMGLTAAAVTGVFLIGSIFVKNLWCRYLCPYGALVGLVSMLSPMRIRRDPDTCIDCAKCAKACPSLLPVDALVQIRSAECIGCLECIESCPEEGALFYSALNRRRVTAWQVAACVAAVFFLFVGVAKWTGHWQSAIPAAVYRELVPNANTLDHPR